MGKHQKGASIIQKIIHYLDQEIETVVPEVKNDDKKYDVIIIDEAQDFSDEWMISIEQMLRKNGKFYVYDQQQSIFERKSQYF